LGKLVSPKICVGQFNHQNYIGTRCKPNSLSASPSPTRLPGRARLRPDDQPKPSYQVKPGTLLVRPGHARAGPRPCQVISPLTGRPIWTCVSLTQPCSAKASRLDLLCGHNIGGVSQERYRWGERIFVGTRNICKTRNFTATTIKIE
jgi:hypothetical protein